MGSAKTKSWWETIGGIMTGIAALITAITGLIIGLHKIEKDEDTSEAQKTVAIQSPHQVTASKNPTLEKSIPEYSSSALKTVDQQPYSIDLPTPRERTIGTVYDKTIYLLLSGTLLPITPETNELKIRVRATSRGEYPSAFSSFQFSLVIDGKRMPSERSFNYRIPSRESREADVFFSIPADTKNAVLQINVHTHDAEFPLDLIRPANNKRTEISIGQNSDSTEPAKTDRISYPINLPSKREYVLGPERVAANYLLLSGEISRLTSESDLLTIHVRLANLVDTQNGKTFDSRLFHLVADRKKIRPKENFNYFVLPQKFREEDVLFVIPHGLKEATLKIGNYLDGVDIPLDLTPKS